jgi:hypothetical protein
MALMCNADRNIQEAVHLFKRIANRRESQRWRHHILSDNLMYIR